MKNCCKYYLIYLILNLLISGQIFAQSTKITGTVTDEQTGEPIPFVNVKLKDVDVGTITDFYGKFKIDTKLFSDTIIFSCLGYNEVRKKIYKNKYQQVDIKMTPASVELNEVVIKPKKIKKRDDPAIILFEKILDHKKQNNYDKLNSYEYEVYNKVQFDINNIQEKFKNRKLLKPFNFIFDYVDTSVVNGKPYLPIFLIESVSDYYFRRFPRMEKEIIKATKVSGVENESIQQFMGKMYANINIYKNYIDLFGKGWISPIANTGRLFYNYYLIDSASIDNHWCYQLVFRPKTKQDYVFNGNLWVCDTTYAIKKIELRIDTMVNINFINNLDIIQEFDNIDDTTFMISKEQMIVDFNIVENPKNIMGFFGRRTSTYRNIKINSEPDEKFLSNISNSNIIVEDNAGNKDETYWDTIRHEELTEKEKQIYHMVDTIKNIPAFRTFYDIMYTIVTYYYVWGNFELGPYFTFYSFNQVEGHRFKLGARTSNKVSTKIMPEAYIAYGTKDNKFKYGANILYLYNKNPRRGFFASYKNDMELLGQSVNAFREDNIMSSLLRRNPNNRLSMVEEYQLSYEHEWFQGFSNTLTYKNRTIYPVPELGVFEMTIDNQDIIAPNITTSDLTLHTRFAYKEKFVMGEFERISLGTTYPIIDIYYTKGFKDFLHGEFNYDKLEINIEDWFNVYPLGYTRYMINAGKIWGNIPFPLLKIHEGNETYGFDMYSFNLMNYYEFVSDAYLSLYISHYFEGLFLNKIPLFKKLKWREVIWGKGVVGTLRQENMAIMSFLPNMSGFDNPNNNINLLKPYLEGGVGIENIFKFFRIDLIKRFSYLNHENISPLGLRLSLQVKF
ncbi:MAG: DUF5686 and carboxypeptidase-like regulatory domain-containing protein [Marinilabiliales bacterium]